MIELEKELQEQKNAEEIEAMLKAAASRQNQHLDLSNIKLSSNNSTTNFNNNGNHNNNNNNQNNNGYNNGNNINNNSSTHTNGNSNTPGTPDKNDTPRGRASRANYGLSREALSMLVSGAQFNVPNFLGLKSPKFYFVSTDILSIGSRSSSKKTQRLTGFDKFES